MANVPPGWGEDELTGYFEHSRRNSFASFVHTGERYRKLAQVAAACELVRDSLHEPEDRNAPLFFFKAHASFLQAANLAMAGSIPESFMVMRGSIESALYGLYINKNPDSMAVWAARHDGIEQRKRVRSTFTIGRMWECLATADPSLVAAVDALYDKTIDQGAHPNVGSMSLATTVVRLESKTQFRLAYLTADAAVIQGAMKSVAQVGVVVLDIFRSVCPERFKQLGITELLPELRAGL